MSNPFKVGDIVVFKADRSDDLWPVTFGKEYTITKTELELVMITEDNGKETYYHGDYFEKVGSVPPAPAVKATSWKIGSVDFILEDDEHVSIFGSGEITISIEHLKVILETVQMTVQSK